MAAISIDDVTPDVNLDIVEVVVNSDITEENAVKKAKMGSTEISSDVIEEGGMEKKGDIAMAKIAQKKIGPGKRVPFSSQFPAKNSIAMLYEYQSGIDFKIVSQTVEQNVPIVVFSVEVDGKVPVNFIDYFFLRYLNERMKV